MGNHEVVLLTLMQQTQESEPDALAADLAPLLRPTSLKPTSPAY
ncbi:MAG: hypothetical protein ACLS8R_01730 [Anaeromassilibacillus sp.]